MAKSMGVKAAHNDVKTKYSLEENLYGPVKSFLVICQVFGTAPAHVHIELDPSKDLSASSCTSSVGILKMLHFLWCGFVLTCVLVSTYYQYVEFDFVMPIIQKALYISEYISNALNVVIIVFGCYMKRKLYQSYFDRIIEIDLKLQHFCVSLGTQLIGKLMQLFLASFVVFFSLVLIVDFLYNEMSARAFFRSSSVYTTPNIISLFSLAQYWTLLFCIQIRHSKINYLLQHKGYKNYHKRGSQLQYGLNEGVFRANILPNRKPNEVNLHEAINVIRTLNADLDALTSDVTSTFGALILTIFIASFLILSIQIFALYKMLDGNSFNIYLLCYTILWIVLHFGKMLLVLSANNELIKEKSKTRGLLNEIEPMNQEAEISVNRFILQLMAQSRAPIVCGIIELDMMFVGTVAGALTTYVIFLIQFDLGSVTLSATTGNQSIVHPNFTHRL